MEICRNASHNSKQISLLLLFPEGTRVPLLPFTAHRITFSCSLRAFHGKTIHLPVTRKYQPCVRFLAVSCSDTHFPCRAFVSSLSVKSRLSRILIFPNTLSSIPEATWADTSGGHQHHKIIPTHDLAILLARDQSLIMVSLTEQSAIETI